MPDNQNTQLADLVLTSAKSRFAAQRNLADRAIAQVSDENLRRPLDENTNSIALIMKHVAGNMVSRWTNFLTTDGEKPDRFRDNEFVDDFESREQIDAAWSAGWKRLFETLDTLTADDLHKSITIRGYPHTAIDAIHRQLDHYGYHVGQIVQLARHYAGDNWTTLSVPRGPGESEKYNQATWKR